MGEDVIAFTVVPESMTDGKAERLDLLLAKHLRQDTSALAGYSRSKCAKLIEAGRVRVNGQQVLRAAHLVGGGAKIEIDVQRIAAEHGLELIADPTVTFKIIFEDDELIVIDKPPNLVVHPGAGRESGTLVHGMLAHCGDKFRTVGSAARPGIVHRLDKDTTGLLVAAKTELAYQGLIAQFRSREISRQYLALAIGVPQSVKRGGVLPKSDSASGEILTKVVRSERDRTRFVVSTSRGKDAQTSWEVRETFKFGALLALRLATGRTHQIRVHLASVGAAIVGDQVYGAPLSQIPAPLRGVVRLFGRQALHAARLSFVHPKSGVRLEFQAPLPEDMAQLIERFRLFKG